VYFLLGAANDFARSVGLSLEDLTATLLIVADTAAFPIDLELFETLRQHVDGRFGSQVTAETDFALKRRLGRLA
jgi:diacylglycerol kinase family enzyme